jgi:hypothetical protein
MATVPPLPVSTHATWTRLVHTVAAKARATYPLLGGKIDHATTLVLSGGVEQLGAQPEYLVQSETDLTGLEPYSVLCGQPTTCTCKDYEVHTTEKDYRCKHILAVWSYRRALATQEPAPAASAATLPEAAFSLTLKGLMDGPEVMLTVRGQTPKEFKANLTVVRGLFDAPPAAKPAAEGWCGRHGVQMKLNHGKDGRQWYSHKTAGGWCKGR